MSSDTANNDLDMDAEIKEIHEKLRDGEYTLRVFHPVDGSDPRVTLNTNGDDFPLSDTSKIDQVRQPYEELLLSVDKINREYDGMERAWRVGSFLKELDEDVEDLSVNEFLNLAEIDDLGKTTANRFRSVAEVYPDGDYPEDIIVRVAAFVAQKYDPAVAKEIIEHAEENSIEPSKKALRAWHSINDTGFNNVVEHVHSLNVADPVDVVQDVYRMNGDRPPSSGRIRRKVADIEATERKKFAGGTVDSDDDTTDDDGGVNLFATGNDSDSTSDSGEDDADGKGVERVRSTDGGTAASETVEQAKNGDNRTETTLDMHANEGVKSDQSGESDQMGNSDSGEAEQDVLPGEPENTLETVDESEISDYTIVELLNAAIEEDVDNIVGVMKQTISEYDGDVEGSEWLDTVGELEDIVEIDDEIEQKWQIGAVLKEVRTNSTLSRSDLLDLEWLSHVGNSSGYYYEKLSTVYPEGDYPPNTSARNVYRAAVGGESMGEARNAHQHVTDLPVTTAEEVLSVWGDLEGSTVDEIVATLVSGYEEIDDPGVVLSRLASIEEAAEEDINDALRKSDADEATKLLEERTSTESDDGGEESPGITDLPADEDGQIIRLSDQAEDHLASNDDFVLLDTALSNRIQLPEENSDMAKKAVIPAGLPMDSISLPERVEQAETITALEAASYADRPACFITPDDSNDAASLSLLAFTQAGGETVLYGGCGPGGSDGSQAFFDILHDEYEYVTTIGSQDRSGEEIEVPLHVYTGDGSYDGGGVLSSPFR